jgi:hypothetical protein
MRQLTAAKCRYGSLAAAATEVCGVRFIPQSCRGRRQPAWQLRANRDQSALPRSHPYSTTSSAIANTPDGMLNLSFLAVFRFKEECEFGGRLYRQIGRLQASSRCEAGSPLLRAFGLG